MSEDRLYFAYGSNINLDQMAHRCPAAEVVGPVVLENYRLLFRGNYRGNGVATIVPRKGSKVHGLLWKITPECEKSLDAYEAFPHLYEKQSVTVQDQSGQEFPVMAYIMTERCKEPAVPSNFYYNGILEGYRQNGLPTAALKRAWEHSAKEVHAWTTQLNQQANLSGKKKGRSGHER